MTPFHFPWEWLWSLEPQEKKGACSEVVKDPRPEKPFLSLSHSRAEHQKRGRDAQVVQMRKLKFRAPSSSSQTSAVRLERLVMLAPSAWPCPLGNLIHEGKILRKPELHPQTWKDNVPTVLPDVVSLSDMDSGGWFCWGSDAFFGKYQISAPSARLPLHSQIQSDRVLPTGLRGERKLDLHAEITLHFIQAAARFFSQGRGAQFDRSF